MLRSWCCRAPGRGQRRAHTGVASRHVGDASQLAARGTAWRGGVRPCIGGLLGKMKEAATDSITLCTVEYSCTREGKLLQYLLLLAAAP